MQICAKNSAHTAATVQTQMHSEYSHYTNTSARARQARKKSLSDKHIRAALTAIGFALLIAGGRATLFVAAVGVLAMWTGTARNA